MTAATQSSGGRPSPEVRVGATSLALTTTIAPFLIFGFIALYVYDYRCNESCGVSTGPYAVHGWSHFRDGSQWGLQFWLLALPTLIALAAFVVFLGTGRPGRAVTALTVSVLGFAAWVYFPVLTGGATAPSLPNLSHSGPRLVALAFVVWLLGAAVSIALEFLSVHRATGDGTENTAQ
jgi:hypothetical protein